MSDRRTADAETLQGAALVASLERRFRTVIVDVAVGNATYSILKPANADDLIREEDFVKDERLPYWADVWPSSTILAARLRELNGKGVSALELGCGVGLCTIAARSVGCDVLSTDYYDDALEFTRANVFRNLGGDANTMLFDWRHPPRNLGRYDVVLASDVLYELEYATLLPPILDQTLAERGFALIADPGRVAVQLFLESCGQRGLVARKEETRPFESGEIRQRIDIYSVRRAT